MLWLRSPPATSLSSPPFGPSCPIPSCRHAPTPQERVKGIEPSSLAWKAMALPLSYTRFPVKNAKSKGRNPKTLRRSHFGTSRLVFRISPPMGGAGFEPAKAEPSDLQSDPFDRSGNPPTLAANLPLACRKGMRRNPRRTEPRTARDRWKIGGFRYELAEGLEPTTC